MSQNKFDFSAFSFAPVIHLPKQYDVYDLSRGLPPSQNHPYGIGKYAEPRPGMYNGPQFTEGHRHIHVGLDIACPVGTPVYAFYPGIIYLKSIRSMPGDYGGLVITQHQLEDKTLWAVHGHLSHSSAQTGLQQGQSFKAGDVLGEIGSESENGGWPPHLHFQLSWIEPQNGDLPGVVGPQDLPTALQNFPDPRLVLGPLYQD